MTAYYNEIDPYAAQWLRNLIAAGLIAGGEVDERDIRDVHPGDLRGFDQCHFFAGVGVWSHALRSAGWPDDRPVWTGSCPCQPFSAAGRRGGVDDERHLWPSFFHLIEACHPPVVFGEQVASKDGLAWLDLVQADMEGANYAFRPFDLCAAGFGAPHIRQRLYFVADALPAGRAEGWPITGGGQVAGGSRPGGLAVAHGDEYWADGSGRHRAAQRIPVVNRQGVTGSGEPGGTGSPLLGVAQGDADDSGLEGWRLSAERARELFAGQAGVAGFWGDADWIYCRDRKYRPVEPGTFPLAHGAPARVGRLRAYGNALVAPLAEEFVRAFLGAESCLTDAVATC